MRGVMQLEKYAEKIGALGVVLALLTLTVLLVGGYWWPESGDWEKTIRLVTCISLLCLLGQLFKERLRLLAPTFLLFLLLWCVLMLNSILTESYSSVRQLLLILFFTWMVMLLGGKEGRGWLAVLTVSALAPACFAGLSLVNKMLVGEFDTSYRGMYIHDSGIPGVAEFGITIEAGLHYAFALVISVWLLLKSRKPAHCMLWSACVVVLLIYLYFTFARSAWVAGLLASAVLVITMTEGRLRRQIGWVAVLVTCAVVVVGFEQVVYEFGDRGLTDRDEVWAAVFERIGENWWFGHGSHTELGKVALTNGAIVSNPHSLYLEALYQFGLVGLAALWLAMGACIWALRKTTSDLGRLWLAVLSASSVLMLVEMHFFVDAPNVVWLWLWLPLAGAVAVTTQNKVGALRR